MEEQKVDRLDQIITKLVDNSIGEGPAGGSDAINISSRLDKVERTIEGVERTVERLKRTVEDTKEATDMILQILQKK